MPLEQSGSNKAPQTVADEYVSTAVNVFPDSTTAAEINNINRQYWASAGGEQTGGK